MIAASSTDRIIVPTDILEEMRRLYERGLYLQAYQLATAMGPLESWSGTDAQVLAGRVAMQMGAYRLARLLHLRAWRQDRRHPEACYYRASGLLQRRGPLAAWESLSRRGDMPEARPDVRADWLALHATVSGLLRDFDAAEDWINRAEALRPERPWVLCERAALLEREDRYEDALATLQKALTLHPWYRPAVQAAAHILQLLERDPEALALLTEAAQHLESPPVVAQLALLQTELNQYEAAWQSYERFAELSPMLEKEMALWLAARQADVACYRGDLDRAAEYARQVTGDPFYEQLAKRLAEKPADGKRVQLPVAFIRQHHKTCAPATLTAISRYWSMPAEQLEIAADICYDGTPAYSERRWAEEHGWLTREFTVTRDSARLLLERGMPFTLTVVETDYAHLQGVIGYDSYRDTLLIRDPYQRYFGEYGTEPFLQRYQPTGPRGMVMVPKERAELLADLDLPDAAIYDQLHRLERALEKHDRDGARQIQEEMLVQHPNHRLTWHARRILASYDANPTELLAGVAGLLALYPDNAPLLLAKLGCLRDLARREERLELLHKLCADPRGDPVFWQVCAGELAADAREHRAAALLLRRFLHLRPGSAFGYHSLANILWVQRRYAEALPLYRWAACLEDRDEGFARDYFAAARHLRETTTALEFLRSRFRRFGARSGQPARTLFGALEQIGAIQESFEILEEALQLLPEDGELLLFAARMYASYGREERGEALLAAAKGHCRHTSWLRSAATLALLRADRSESLQLWRQVLAIEPLALDAHREIALQLAETEGRPAALAHLQQVCERFPHHYALHQLWNDWLREDGPAAQEPAVRRIVEIHPSDAWARRELALVLGDQNRLEEAFAQLEMAHVLEPTNPSYYTVCGRLRAQAGQREEAKEAYRQAIRLSVDCELAITELLAESETLAERREALALIEAELIRQVVAGAGLLAFRDAARHLLDPDVLLTALRKGLEARPDLWQAWSAVTRQLIAMEELDAALEQARQAAARFPLLPAMWLDLALVCQARQDVAGEVEALKHALQINSAWGTAARQLAGTYRAGGQLREARQILEDIIRKAPLEVANHASLADLLWHMGEKDAALERIQHVLRLHPGYDWAWNALRDWCRQMDKADAAAQFVRELTERRPGEARSWLMLARTLFQAEELQDRLDALDRALALNPRLADAHDLRAELLALAGRFEEALAACNAPIWQGQPTLILRGRSAWIEARRGHISEAIAQMKAVLEQAPDYWWGWDQLAGWCRTAQDHEGYKSAGEALVRLAPRDPVSYGYLGEAKLRLGDREGARDAYRRSIAVAPSYTFGGLQLFHLQLDDNQMDEAAATLDTVRAHGNGDDIRAAVVRLETARGNREAARAALLELCSSPGCDRWALDPALADMRQAGWDEAANAVLAEVLKSDDVSPAVAAIWVRRRMTRDTAGVAERVEELLATDETGSAALSAYVEVLGETKRTAELRRCLQKHRERLRSDSRLWGSAGYALNTVDRYAEAAEWLADYQERSALAPWMLINLVIALRALGRDVEANQASQQALALPGDYTTVYHRLWLTLDEVLEGRPGVVDPLAGTSAADLDPTHRFLYALLQGLCSVQQAGPADRRPAFFAALRQWQQAAVQCSPLHQDRPAVARSYRRCVRRLARDCRAMTATLWSWWRCLFPLLPARSGSMPNR